MFINYTETATKCNRWYNLQINAVIKYYFAVH